MTPNSTNDCKANKLLQRKNYCSRILQKKSAKSAPSNFPLSKALALKKEIELNPKSHTLFHFTKNNETLKLIIKNGFWPRYCLEDVGWLRYKKFDFIAYPMVCFCDIPISRVDEHVNFYGKFGIGLSKEWAEANRLTPILYVASNNHIPDSYRKIIDLAYNLEETAKNEAKKSVRYLLAHAKPTDGNMVIGGEFVPKEFHQESEWEV